MRPGELKELGRPQRHPALGPGQYYPNPLHYDERWAAESRWGDRGTAVVRTVATRMPSASPLHRQDPRLAPDVGDATTGGSLAPHRRGDLLVLRTGVPTTGGETRVFAEARAGLVGRRLINQKGERVALQRSAAIATGCREPGEGPLRRRRRWWRRLGRARRRRHRRRRAGVDRRAAGRAGRPGSHRRIRRSATASGCSSSVAAGDSSPSASSGAQPRVVRDRVAGPAP